MTWLYDHLGCGVAVLIASGFSILAYDCWMYKRGLLRPRD